SAASRFQTAPSPERSQAVRAVFLARSLALLDPQPASLRGRGDVLELECFHVRRLDLRPPPAGREDDVHRKRGSADRMEKPEPLHVGLRPEFPREPPERNRSFRRQDRLKAPAVGPRSVGAAAAAGTANLAVTPAPGGFEGKEPAAAQTDIRRTSDPSQHDGNLTVALEDGVKKDGRFNPAFTSFSPGRRPPLVGFPAPEPDT